MGCIAHLPKSVINHLRSSSILADLSQVVEELICNSLDAGARKICVYIDLASFYIKVEDDGSGVTRDDLLVMGERHATSKLHDVVDLESGVKTLGFRGEALSSLSDMGILEIVTRVRGSPNTYKKILKGSKKLSLGLSGEQRAPGTTVVLRELFHNLPVRRKVTESSPKKVLQGVKDRSMRLALIHPDVSFTVTDLERQEDLVRTKAQLSSLDTLCEFYGKHIRHELQELCYTKKSLKINGFISRETNPFSSKAIQFLYLNSRFVHKTPIHKLINKLFWQNKVGHELRNSFDTGMPSTALKQVYPMFLLNLHCPLSCYDITLDVSKTLVEFKDWKSILLFVTEAFGTSWSCLAQNLGEGTERYSWKSDGTVSHKLTPRKRKPWQHVDPTYHSRCNIDMPKPEDDGHKHADEEDANDKMRQMVTYDTPTQTRSLRKRRSYGSGCKENCMHDDSVTSSWTLQPCHTSIKLHKHVKEGENRQELCGREDCRLKEKDFQSVWGDRNVMFMLDDDAIQDTGGSRSPKCASMKEFPCRDDISLTLSAVPRSGILSPAMQSDVLGTCPRFKDLSFDRQVDQFEGVTRTEYTLDIGGARNSMAEFLHTPPSLRRSFSSASPKVRRCLYDLDLKSSYTNSFLCHAERQTVSNLEMRSAYTDEEEVWTPKEALGSDHGFYRDDQEEFEQECHEDDLLSLRNSHNLLEYRSLLSSPRGRETDMFDLLPSPALDKGHKRSQHYLLEETIVKSSVESGHGEEVDRCDFLQIPLTDCLRVGSKAAASEKRGKAFGKKPRKKSLNTQLRRTLSGPPFYQPPLKHAATAGLSTLDWRREHTSGHDLKKCLKTFDKVQAPFLCADLQDNSRNEKKVAKSLKDRLQNSTAAIASGSNFTSEKRGLQEPAKPQLEHIQTMSPSKRDDDGLVNSKWRGSVHDDMATKDGLEDTALQLYKDWTNPCIRNAEPDILDLSSGVLGPSNKHLLPESISKDSLQKTRVLQQMDKKFIATMAEQTLVVIDQHAADERVRLEQFRKEVLDDKQRLSTLLDYPQELSISLGEQQLLHTYKGHVEGWGWRIKTLMERHSNNKRRYGHSHLGNTAALLTGVPNILGESLRDSKYLSEYLHQLASTEGTSTPPPAVLRLLASKACRGAIMFGDHLLRSECQQLVEGLKKTALSFQCAHGRPTLVPIVNLEALHKRLDKHENRKRLACTADGAGTGCGAAWHGLQWHRSTLERATERLRQAEGM